MAATDEWSLPARRARVLFAAPGTVVLEDEPAPSPGRGEVLVRSTCSAISAGTELLALRGGVGAGTALDPHLPGLGGAFTFPFVFGYALAGRVVAAGSDVEAGWVGRRVMAFVPHQSCFVAAPETLWPLPDDVADERAVFLPTVETAVGLVHDAAPLCGERVLVVGLGVVGLAVSALCQRFPLAAVVGIDARPSRRRAAAELGLAAAVAPGEAITHWAAGAGDGADLVFELSGTAAGLDEAVARCGAEGRVIVGSWYGDAPVPVRLGTHFHRGRIRLVSSQVSTIAPALGGRWSRERRLAFATELLARLRPERWITHRLPVSEAPAAYALLQGEPGECLQVLLTY